MNWFTSDWHLGHNNIIKYCNRPFKDVDEMNWAIINNCNSVVRPQDSLYFLGDFCLSSKTSVIEAWLMQIKCRNLFLVYGNHDKTLITNRWLVDKYFVKAGDMMTVKNQYPDIILNHYKMCIWDRQHYGTYHLYGHSHGTATNELDKLSLDVGVDCHNFFPLNFKQIQDKMATKLRLEEGCGLNDI